MLNNSGFEYTADFAKSGFKPVRHFFIATKKFHLRQNSMTMFTIGIGFLWTSADKYSGKLRAEEYLQEEFQFLIRPNIEF
ncbi:MAG: hypothetical protein HY746_01990 [Elusimicrobia bacterium]|nr:hypothetical protein [Elusimicrobiota bacterium]